MPNFMGGMAEEIERSKELVKKVVDDVAADMVVSPQVSAVQSAQRQMASVDSMRQMLYDIQEMFVGMQGRDNVGIIYIPVSFSLSPKWVKAMTEFRRKAKIVVDYFNTETLEMRRTEMHMEGYKAGVVKDTSYKGLWKVSFTLREF